MTISQRTNCCGTSENPFKVVHGIHGAVADGDSKPEKQALSGGIIMQVWDDNQWLQSFWMRKATFLNLCDKSTPTLRRRDTRIRGALTVEK